MPKIDLGIKNKKHFAKALKIRCGCLLICFHPSKTKKLQDIPHL